jgi:hypothetical protein
VRIVASRFMPTAVGVLRREHLLGEVVAAGGVETPRADRCRHEGDFERKSG